MELLLVGVLAGYARRLFGEAREQHTATLDRMSQLTEANELLVSLHRVAQSLPASLDLQQALASTVSRLRSLIDCDVVAVLLHDDATEHLDRGRLRGSGAAPDFQPTPTSPDRWPPPPPAAWPPWSSASARARASGPTSCRGPACTPPCGPGACSLGPHRHRATRARLLRPSGPAHPRRLRGAGRPGHRQRPVVLPAADHRCRRGAGAHRPGHPRQRRPIPGLRRIQARSAGRDGRRPEDARRARRPPHRGARRPHRGARHPLRPAHRGHRRPRTWSARWRSSWTGSAPGPTSR